MQPSSLIQLTGQLVIDSFGRALLLVAGSAPAVLVFENAPALDAASTGAMASFLTNVRSFNSGVPLTVMGIPETFNDVRAIRVRSVL